MYIHIYVYIYIERETEREIEIYIYVYYITSVCIKRCMRVRRFVSNVACVHTHAQMQLNGDDEAMLSRMRVMDHARENVLRVCARVREIAGGCVCQARGALNPN